MTYASTKCNYLNNFYKIDIWKNQYRNAINYLSKILFPVFENYFFCALWNIIKDTHSEYTDAQIIVEMYVLLRDYLNNSKNVNMLFDTDNVIVKDNPRLERTNIIHPSLKYDSNAKIDTTIYKHCLIASTLTYKDKPIPDFITSAYLDDIIGRHQKYIQYLYITEYAIYKR